MPFPTTGELDSFNRGNSASLGSDWTNDSIGAGSAGIAIDTNQASNTLGGYGEMYYDVASYSNPEIWTDVATFADGSSWSGGLRILTSPGSAAADGYGMVVSQSGRFKIVRVDNGDDSLELDDQAHSAADGEEIGLSYNEDTGELIGYIDGVEVATATDNTYNGPFYLSLWGYNGGGGSSVFRWERFGGGAMVLVPPEATPVLPSYARFPKSKLIRP